MQKRKKDLPERSKNDTFMTARHSKYHTLEHAMSNLIEQLKLNGFSVWHYKIEDVILDSKYEDSKGLLN